MATLRSALGAEELARAGAAGRALTLDQAVEQALAAAGLSGRISA
jgi:hypothetical protein